MSTLLPYPIGRQGVPWSEAEVETWASLQIVQRSYDSDVRQAIDRLRSRFDILQYGRLDDGPNRHPLFALKSRAWNASLPCALVTGGVHGYETSGVHGALRFAEKRAHDYEGAANLLIVPCVSPWSYEVIHRWNRRAIDPNRSFRDDSPAVESAALMRLVRSMRDDILVHVDLHETTDSDESNFRPALAARDGLKHIPGVIPDGFYLVDDSEHPRPAFQESIIQRVASVTHIAQADDRGQLIGSPIVAPGVINYPLTQLGLCAGMTSAPYKTTTEVYPDSPRTTPEQCNDAQVAAVCAAIDYALAHPAGED